MKGEPILHESLRVAAAHFALGLTETDHLVRAANETIDAGHFSPSLGELILLRHPTWSDCGPLFCSALRELGASLPEPRDAIALILDHHAIRLVEGVVGVGEGLAELRSIDQELRFSPGGNLDTRILEPLRPFVGQYWALDEYWAVARYLDLPAVQDPNDPGVLQIHDETLALAFNWCHDRWQSRLRPQWHTANVRAVARGIAADSAFDRLPLLADALLDEGCDVPEIIEHLMSGRPHVRTCFVLGLLGDL